MFIPAPPKDESAAEQGNQPGRGKGLNRTVLFLCSAIGCQCLSAFFTFLPWSREFGETFAGYQAHPLVPLYDGLAGKLNLVASLVFFIGVCTVTPRPSRLSFNVYTYSMMSWNVVFVIWLIFLHVRLGIFRSYGLTLAFGPPLAVIACLVSATVAHQAEKVTLPAENAAKIRSRKRAGR